MTSSQDSPTPEIPKLPSALDRSAASMRQHREAVLKETPGTPEYEKAKWQYDKSGKRFVDDCQEITGYEDKFKPRYHLSSGQIAEAKTEYKSAMAERIIRMAKDPSAKSSASCYNYIAKITQAASIDACRKIAKGRKIKGELKFLEISSDTPVNNNGGDSNSILDELADGTENDSLSLNEIRDTSRKITLISRPDISLWDVLELILQGFAMREIGLKLVVNPDTLSSFIRSDRVKDYMKPFLTLSLLIFLLMATEYR
jgi:hypothetical protein